MIATAYPHIEIGQDGVPILAGTQTKVVELVMAHAAFSWDADEIHRQHPDLSLAQIHSALAYYYDNQADIDADIQKRLRREQELIDQLGDSPIQLKLRASKRAALGLMP